MEVSQTQYTGRKARVGRICFTRDRMRVFAGYCPDCRGKVVMSLDEARQFANSYSTEVAKRNVKSLLKAKIKFEV